MAIQGKSISLEARLRIVEAVLVHGLKIGEVAKSHGINRKTVRCFIQRYRAEGPNGLVERSRRPTQSPLRKSADCTRQVLELRQQHGWGAGRIGALIGASGSTVHRILCEHGLNDLTPPRRKYERYEMDYPGELVHIDSKELVPLAPGQGKQYLFAALDGYSREVFVGIHDKANAVTSLDFLQYVLGNVPYRIGAVMTDNALAFSMRRSAHPERESPFQKMLRQLGIDHRLTKPYTPRTNGKVERFFGTVGRELLRCVRFRNPQHRIDELQSFAAYYNESRPHSAIGFNAPTPYRIHYFHTVR